MPQIVSDMIAYTCVLYVASVVDFRAKQFFNALGHIGRTRKLQLKHFYFSLQAGWWWKSCGRGLNGLIIGFQWNGFEFELKKTTMMIKIIK